MIKDKDEKPNDNSPRSDVPDLLASFTNTSEAQAPPKKSSYLGKILGGALGGIAVGGAVGAGTGITLGWLTGPAWPLVIIACVIGGAAIGGTLVGGGVGVAVGHCYDKSSTATVRSGLAPIPKVGSAEIENGNTNSVVIPVITKRSSSKKSFLSFINCCHERDVASDPIKHRVEHT